MTDLEEAIFDSSILPKKVIQAKFAGTHVEVKTFDHLNRRCHIQKLNKDFYVIKSTGELQEANHQTKRTDDKSSLYRTIAYGRDLIRANTPYSSHVLFLTLTYKDNMTDTNKLRYDFGNFIKRIPEQFKPFKWICSVEPQQRGAWHCHVLFIYQSIAPFLPNDVVFNSWKHGFTKTKKVDNVDDIGAYLCAYLTDIELDDDEMFSNNDISIKNVDGKSKRILKGGRLSYYPAGFRIFRCSTNCVKPRKVYYSEKTYYKWKEAHTPYYTHEKELILGDYSNTIKTECYNLNRKPN